MSEEAKKAEDIILKAVDSTETPKFYANGFNNGLGIGDIVTVLMQNNKPVAVVNLSYTVAKTLAIKLNDLILRLEEDTGNVIMTTDQIEKSLSSKGKVE